MSKVIKYFKQWWLRRQLFKACEESGRRVSAMSREERQRLTQQALSIIYPNGYWTCQNHGLTEVRVPKGEPCKLCGLDMVIQLETQPNEQ